MATLEHRLLTGSTPMRNTARFGLLLGLGLLGCHRHARYEVGAAGGPQASDRQVHNAVHQAAADMQCPEATLRPEQIGESLYSVHGCGRSREYLLQCANRHSCRWQPVVPVEQVAAAETQCTQFTIAEPSVIERSLTGCGITSVYMIGCNVAACAWGHSAGSVASGTVVASSGPPVTAAPPPTAAPATADPQNALMMVASDRWTRAQQCLNGQHVDATLTLGLDGRVTAALDAPMHGTPVEACVQQVVGDVTVSMAGQTSPVSVMLTL
jgi:hypothetical protein